MDGEINADSVARRSFGSALRGYDRDEVDAFRRQVAAHLESLEAELNVTRQKLAQLGFDDVPQLSDELARVGQDISTILAEAQRAATDMRERAADDAASWRREAEDEAAAFRRSAQEDAEHVRRDAWREGTDLLDLAQEEAERIVAGGRQDVLFIRAEAEREVLRLTGEARREAEDLLRNARAEADRMVAAADAEAEEAVAEAQRSMQGTLERTKTLEARHSELLAEIEAAQTALNAMQTRGVDAQRVVRPGDEPAEQSWEQDDDESGAVRIVSSGRSAMSSPVDADELVAEVERMRSERFAVPEPAAPPAVDPGTAPADVSSEPEPHRPSRDDMDTGVADPAETPVRAEGVTAPSPTEEPAAFEADEVPAEKAAPPPSADDAPATEVVSADDGADAVEEAGAEATAETIAASPGGEEAGAEEEAESIAARPGGEEDALGDLFARLRSRSEEAKGEGAGEAPDTTTESTAVDESATATSDSSGPSVPAPAPAVAAASGEGAFELRDRLLVPIHNDTLRTVKRHVLDLQNRVLEELRTSAQGWQPERREFVEVMGEDIDAMSGRAYAAGTSAAAQLTGQADLSVGPAPTDDATAGFADALLAAVSAGHSHAAAHDAGSRETAAAVSRVFRAWRTDEAERRLRFAAYRAYHQGLLAGLAAAGIAAVTAVTMGRPCAECPAGREWAPRGSLPAGSALPPAHLECVTTIVPAGMAD